MIMDAPEKIESRLINGVEYYAAPDAARLLHMSLSGMQRKLERLNIKRVKYAGSNRTYIKKSDIEDLLKIEEI